MGEQASKCVLSIHCELARESPSRTRSSPLGIFRNKFLSSVKHNVAFFANLSFTNSTTASRRHLHHGVHRRSLYLHAERQLQCMCLHSRFEHASIESLTDNPHLARLREKRTLYQLQQLEGDQDTPANSENTQQDQPDDPTHYVLITPTEVVERLNVLLSERASQCSPSVTPTGYVSITNAQMMALLASHHGQSDRPIEYVLISDAAKGHILLLLNAKDYPRCREQQKASLTSFMEDLREPSWPRRVWDMMKVYSFWLYCCLMCIVRFYGRN